MNNSDGTAPRIAIAGFQHETNTFSTTVAGLEQFKMADSWPGLLAGAGVISGTAGLNLPIAGFAQAGAAAGFDLHPILWCAAEPSGPVTTYVFETIANRILDGLRSSGQIDGVYLDLHGAMVTQHYDEAEAELLARVRSVIGPDVPLCISLDLHANISARTVALADGVLIYRTYPHLDMADTGARAADYMCRLLGGWRPARSFRQVPYLIPLHAQFTGQGPCAEIYAQAQRNKDVIAEVALGFTAADTPHTGVSVVTHADTQAQADAEADRILDVILSQEAMFDTDIPDADDAVAQALSIATTTDRPVVIADVQDNAGAGGSADTTGLLAALVAADAPSAVLGLIADADLAALAHHRGQGATFEVMIGGRSGIAGDAPFPARVRVERISDGMCAYSGQMYGGGVAVLGPTALLRIMQGSAGVQVVVTSQRSQCLDRALFEHLRLDLTKTGIIVVKSTVHYRADFDPIASATISAAAPGGFPCRLGDIPYRFLRPGLRLGPMGPAFAR